MKTVVAVVVGVVVPVVVGAVVFQFAETSSSLKVSAQF